MFFIGSIFVIYRIFTEVDFFIAKCKARISLIDVKDAQEDV